MKKTIVGEKLKAHSPQVCETNSLKQRESIFPRLQWGRPTFPFCVICKLLKAVKILL